MKGYILSIIGVCVVGTVISIIVPNSEGGGISKQMRVIIAVCVICVSINPINEIISYINEINIDELIEYDDEIESDYEEIFREYYSSAELQNLKVGIKQLLFDKFGVDGAECTVTLKVSEKGKLERIFITLYGSAVFKNTGEMEEYFAEAFGCEIVTAIG